MLKTEIRKVLKGIERFYEAPQEDLAYFNLVYATPDVLCISRKKDEEKYAYILATGERLQKEKEIKRINALAIPPAWQKVKIASLANAHLQATGRDGKNRKQYRYHPKWTTIRNQTKFYRMLPFAGVLPKIRKRVEADLTAKGWQKEKVLALIVRLLEESHIRIGNSYYAERNKTYGLSTLRNKHVSIFNDKIKFQFIGKKGKEHKVTIRNKKLARLVNRCEELPGWELFQYFDENGNKQKVDSGLVNQYLQECSGAHFTAKDFRTWAASLIVFDTLNTMPTVNSDKEKHKQWVLALDAAAKELNNTRKVCQKYYVHPLLEELHKSEELTPYFKIANSRSKTNNTSLQPNEIALHQLLENYKPEILQKLK
ncbi:DNA topoisomerase IB [Flavobacterium sp. ASW18X]|uniref:DNA topoisomerase IB n=1 Tax=Flavobacterium sp. ASW18X TaxID=2572595 RepID=UPI0010AEE688|nr:DNA topoisomerase IB [Flavobacterium sp. ASW18X]TKD60927.1 DNA topoisomerase IB [Flavobacterium sp. ASW18X]